MQKRNFKYTQKESYTQADVDSLLIQHTEFITTGFKGFVDPQKHEKLLSELTPLKAGARDLHIKNVIKGLTSDDKMDDVITLAQIVADDDDKSIKSKAQKIIDARTYLQIDHGVPAEIVATNKDDTTTAPLPTTKKYPNL